MCLSDINEKLGEESLRELSQQFGEDMVTFQVCDVTKEDSVKTLIEEAERKLNSSLYCFINNAGRYQTLSRSSIKLDSEDHQIL